MKLVLLLVVGAVIGTVYDRWARRRADPERALRLGPLKATGPIVEESLWGVAFALIVYLSGTDAPLALLAGGPDSPVLIVALGIALCGDTPWSAGRIAGDGPV